MTKNESEVTKREVIIGLVLFFSMIGFLIFGFIILEAGKMPENCWDKYQTEEQAILNCEQ
jgi:hypothetical protein